MNQIHQDKKNVLVVDDEPVICELLEDVLDMLGYNPITYGNPLEAIKSFRDNHMNIQFVIMDMMMPVMNGQGVFKEMKKIDPEIKAIILSGYSLIDEIDEMLANGVVGFLQKPVTIEQLTDIISQLE